MTDARSGVDASAKERQAPHVLGTVRAHLWVGKSLFSVLGMDLGEHHLVPRLGFGLGKPASETFSAARWLCESRYARQDTYPRRTLGDAYSQQTRLCRES